METVLAELKPANDYADFDVSASDKDKLIYLIKNLSTLKAELIPYQLSGIPSVRLKQYVHMLRMIDDVDHPLVDTLFEQAMDLAIPGFAYLYKGLYPKSPMKNYKHYQVPPRGHMKHLHQTLRDFESAKTLAKADELAKKALTQYEKVSDHFCIHATSVDLMAGSVWNSGLPEIIPFGSDTGKMSSWRFFTDIDYQALLTFARQQGDGPIWRALWMVGVCQEPKLYELMPTTELATYNIHCMEANKSRLIPKIMTKFCSDKTDSIAKAINLYVAHSSPIDTRALGEDFIDHYRDFFVNNQIHFRVIEFDAPSAKKIQRHLFKQFEQMAEGNQQAKNFVRQFFLRDHRDMIVWDCKFRMKRKSSLSMPYCQFVLRHRHLFSKFELIQILENVNTSLFDIHLINHIFNIKSSTSITLTLLLKILRYLNDFNYGTNRLAKNLLADYLPDHRLKKLSPTQVYQLLAGLNQLEQAPILMDNLINRLRLSSGSFNELNSRQAVFLYRIIDRHSAFPSLAFKSRIGQQLLAKIHLHPLLSERIHLTQQLIFIQNTSTSLALSDRNIANQAMHLWADSVSATLGLDDGSQHYLYRVKPFIDQVFKLASHRDCIKMMDKLACAIQSQFAVSDYLSKLLEPEQHDDYIHTHFNQYDAIASIMSLLSGSKEDRVATLDFLASPISQTTLSSFADFILNHREKRSLLRRFGIEELTVDKQKLIFLLRALYQSFWDFRLQERAVILDSLIISKGDETTVTAHQQAYQDGMAYVAHKLFPHAQTNPRDNFALALLTAYLDTANPHSRQFLLAGLLVTTNEADEKQASIGSKFALLCEHLGPAFVKVAQAVQSNPSTPDDIKADLAHVKGRANPPYRWQLLRLIKARLPQAKRQTIKRVGNLLGSASYNLAINIETIDDQNIVLGLLREHAAEDAEQGFCHLRKTIQFCYHDWIVDSRDIYLALINEACEMSQSELDHEMSDRQHRMAQTLYAKETMDVTTEDDTYQVTLSACHLLDNGPGYRFLTHMPGIEFNDLPTSTENERQLKRLVARLMLEKELTILLSGNPYDSDRHGNQLRIHQTGHTIEIGLYDFGELHLTPMSKAEKSSIAKLLTDLPAAIRSKENLHTLFQRHINEAIRQDEPYRHLIRFNKAVLALQDFQQAISQDDVKDIMSAILPKIDPELAKALKTGIIRSASYAEIGISFFSSVWQSIKGADSTSSPTFSFFK